MKLNYYTVLATYERDCSLLVLAKDIEDAREQAREVDWQDWCQDTDGEAFVMYDIQLEQRKMKRIRSKDMDQAAFTKLLKLKGATECEIEGKTRKWTTKKGLLIAIAFYDGTVLREVFLPDYVEYKAPVVKAPVKRKRTIKAKTGSDSTNETN